LARTHPRCGIWPSRSKQGANPDAGYATVTARAILNVGEIVGRSLACNRVRLVLDAGRPGVFVPGRHVTVQISVRVGPQTVVEGIPVAARL
jgi:hypothetical protein